MAYRREYSEKHPTEDKYYCVLCQYWVNLSDMNTRQLDDDITEEKNCNGCDFTLSHTERARHYMHQLNGRINMLCYRWHHDKRWLPHPDIGMVARHHRVNWCEPMVVLEAPELGKDGHPLTITLCHYPLAVWDRKHYGAIHCHGHSHGNYEAEGRIVDVGVDSAAKLVGEYRPLNLAEIVEFTGD